jgi:hypothetical protein
MPPIQITVVLALSTALLCATVILWLRSKAALATELQRLNARNVFDALYPAPVDHAAEIELLVRAELEADKSRPGSLPASKKMRIEDLERIYPTWRQLVKLGLIRLSRDEAGMVNVNVVKVMKCIADRGHAAAPTPPPSLLETAV